MTNTHCSLRRDRVLQVSLEGQVTNCQEPEECCSMSIPFALQITIHVRSSPARRDSTSRCPNQPQRTPVCLCWSYILLSERGREDFINVHEGCWLLFLCKATFGCVLGKEQLVVHVPGGGGGGGRLVVMSRKKDWCVTKWLKFTTKWSKTGIFSHWRDLAFSKIPFYRYKKAM